MKQQRVVHIVTSAGGHIELVVAVRSAFAGYRRVWVVQPSLRAKVLATEGEEVIELPEYDRRPLGFLKNIFQALGIVLRQRPRMVVTPGSGATVPFCLFTRVLGGRVVFVETMARIIGPSASGRVLSRLAKRVVVQWPELTPSYPTAVVCQPELLRRFGCPNGHPARGVFVSVGTHSQPFNRLLEMVDRAAAAGILPSPVVVQAGSSTYRPRHCQSRAWLSPDDVTAAISRSELVICHAGSGLLSGALRAGRRPLVLPRLARHGEHYDDHQTQIVDKLAGLGLAVPLKDEIRPEDLAAAHPPLSVPAAWADQPRIEDVLAAELEAALGAPRPASSRQLRPERPRRMAMTTNGRIK